MIDTTGGAGDVLSDYPEGLKITPNNFRLADQPQVACVTETTGSISFLDAQVSF